MKNIPILLLLICSLSPKFAQSYDREKQIYYLNSQRCDRYFPFFEKKYKIPSLLLKSISRAETGRPSNDKQHIVSWPWTINNAGKPYYFNSKHEAIKFVEDLKEKGETNIDVGCMQINLRHHPEAFKTLSHAFEPRHNIEYAAKFLTSHFKRFQDWGKAIAAYHSYSEHGLKYSIKVASLFQKEKKLEVEKAKQRKSKLLKKRIKVRALPKREYIN